MSDETITAMASGFEGGLFGLTAIKYYLKRDKAHLNALIVTLLLIFSTAAYLAVR